VYAALNISIFYIQLSVRMLSYKVIIANPTLSNDVIPQFSSYILVSLYKLLTPDTSKPSKLAYNSDPQYPIAQSLADPHTSVSFNTGSQSPLIGNSVSLHL
jgi:hypothetical protein